MENKMDIDFNKIGKGVFELAKKKAADANSTIIYGEGNYVIEEDPKTGEKKILRQANRN